MTNPLKRKEQTRGKNKRIINKYKKQMGIKERERKKNCHKKSTFYSVKFRYKHFIFLINSNLKHDITK